MTREGVCAQNAYILSGVCNQNTFCIRWPSRKYYYIRQYGSRNPFGELHWTTKSLPSSLHQKTSGVTHWYKGRTPSSLPVWKISLLNTSCLYMRLHPNIMKKKWDSVGILASFPSWINKQYLSFLLVSLASLRHLLLPSLFSSPGKIRYLFKDRNECFS